MLITRSYEPSARADKDLALPSVVEVLRRWIPEDGSAVIVDPYSGEAYHQTTMSNSPSNEPFEIPATFHMAAGAYMDMLLADYGEGWADVVILCPYGWQTVAYKPGKEKLGRMLRKGGIAVTLGYNSCGFREVDWMGYRVEEILMVCRGQSYMNDCIVVVERKEGGG